MTYAIEAEGLVKRFGATTALEGADFRARAGSVLGLLGPNGAGKTTAVRILATLLRPDAGRATVGGHDVVREAHQVRELVGLTGQFAAVDETLTGTENLLLIGRLLGLPRRAARQRAADLLAVFGLEQAAGQAAKTYSGGMRRRLDLAASLVGRPRVLCLDEPTTGLDPAGRGELWEVVRARVADGVTVLLTTQYLDEADQLADDIVVIDHGKVVATGTPDELKTKVGGQALQVRPVHPDDLPAVAAVVADLAEAAPEITGGTAVAAISDPAIMPAVVRRLEERGVRVAEFTLRKASLDEIFLTLTGHRAGAGAESAATERRAAA
jgi:oleandomycin transport system ATP-binding protein